MTSPTIITAEWVAPMDAALMRRGGVAIEAGKIAAVGPAEHLRRQFAGALSEDLGPTVLLPGLVNAHVHLELSDLSQGGNPARFVDWIMDLMVQTRRPVQRAVEIGVNQCLRFGVTAAGDISKQCMFTRPALSKGPLRVVSYGEIQAMAQRRTLLDERFAAAADCTYESSHLTVGLSPHAPYTVEPAGYQRCLEYSKRHAKPLATHLAENPQEAEFLEHQTGPFRRLWEIGVNAWDDQVPHYTGGPIRFAADSGLLNHPTLLAHVNYCDDDELTILAAGQASVVYCPRTHAYFGHPPHRWRQMLAAGINVAIGTDSCASSPDLNLVDDLRLLRKLAPETPASDLWQMATLRAARAIGMQSQIGSLTPGKRADLTAFAVKTDDPLEEILHSPQKPFAVWIDGQAVIVSHD